jgi:hypothetical protein
VIAVVIAYPTLGLKQHCFLPVIVDSAVTR